MFVCVSGERHLGYRRQELLGVSFYHLLHPDSMRELQAKHRLGEQTLSLYLPKLSLSLPKLSLNSCLAVTGAESDKSSILLLRLQKEDGGFIWTHSVLQVAIMIC